MHHSVVRLLGLATLAFIACVRAPVPAPQPPTPAPPAAATSNELRAELLLIDEDIGPAELAPPATLDPAAAAHDFARLEYALLHGYGGRALVSAHELDEVLAELERSFTVTAPVEPTALCHDVANALYRIPDAHLSVSLGGQECLADGVEPLRGQVGPNVGPPFPFEAKVPWSVRAVEVGDVGDVGLLSITRYPFSGSAVWNGLLDAVVALERHDAIIIDLRGNSGGDDTTAYRIAQALSGEFLRRDHAYKVSLHSSAAFALQINSITLAIAEARRTGQPVDALLELQRDRFRRLRAAEEHGPELAREELGPLVPLPERFTPYEGRVILLVDRRCGSSCETGVEVLRQLPGAVVIGENTAGALHSGNAGRLLLPNSKLLVMIPMHYVRYEDGRFLERVGLAPDVRVPAGEDALESALAYLRAAAASPSGADATRAGAGGR